MDTAPDGKTPDKEKERKNTLPKVSLIMTTFNCKEHIESTLESALLQDYPNIEIIIQDACSIDGTQKILQSYAARYPDRIHCVSEKDKGIYDGMNRAILRSSGEIIAVFNDLFTCTDAISQMVDAIQRAGRKEEQKGEGEDGAGKGKEKERILGAHADLAYMDGGEVVRRWVMGEGSIEDGWLPAHPTLYLYRWVYDTYGLYDTKYRSSADYEFMVRILKDPHNYLAYVPRELIHMYYGGTSNAGFWGYWQNTREAFSALKANGMPHPYRIIARRILRTLRQFHKEGAAGEEG